MMLIAVGISLIYEAITLKWRDQSLYKCYCCCADYFKAIKLKFSKKQKEPVQQQEIAEPEKADKQNETNKKKN